MMSFLAYCDKMNIQFLSTPFDEESIVLLQSKGITIGKIPSGEITNLPYLQAMAKAFPEHHPYLPVCVICRK